MQIHVGVRGKTTKYKNKTHVSSKKLTQQPSSVERKISQTRESEINEISTKNALTSTKTPGKNRRTGNCIEQYHNPIIVIERRKNKK